MLNNYESKAALQYGPTDHSRTTMEDNEATNAIRLKKMELHKILGANFQYILDRVHQMSLIMDHEFNDLKEKNINSLLDRIMGKGEDTCKLFVGLLQTDPEIQGTFPALKKMQWKVKDPLKRAFVDDPKHHNHDGPVQSKRHTGDDQDKLTSNPTSLCVNINTINILSGDVQPGPRQMVASLKHNQKEIFSTPQKMPPHDDSDDTATGFIHCVTPINMSMKASRVKYFNAILQTGPDQFHHTVIFTPEKHTQFTQAQINCTAVKLSRIKKCFRFSDDSFEVEVSYRSDMVETTVPFEPKQPTDSAKMEIVEVLKMKPRKIGKLDAHVISKNPVKFVNNRGEHQEVKECLICDSSGQIQLQLWGDLIHDVKVNTSYEFSNISTRHKPGETQLYLTCTKYTRITTIDNLLVVPKHPTEQSVDEYPIHISGEISAIDLIGKQRCGLCDKSQMVTQSEFHRCERCMYQQPVASFTLNVSGTIVMTTPTEKLNLTVPPSILTAYLTSCNLLHLLKDTDELGKHFLKHKYFKVLHSAEHVVDSLEQG